MIEIELKMTVTESDYHKLRALLADRKIAEIEQINSFFDTENGRLLKEKRTLRIRIENRETVRATLKGQGQLKDGVATAPEQEIIVADPIRERILKGDIDLEWLQASFLPEGNEPLVEIGGFTNRRSEYRYNQLIVQLDRTVLAEDYIFHEVELEVEDPSAHETIADYLLIHGIAYCHSTKTKFQRFLEWRGLARD